MNSLLANLIKDFEFTGEILEDSMGLLMFHGNQEVAEHTHKVANRSVEIAHKFGADEKSAFTAGCLHDISRVFSEEEMVCIAEKLEIQIIEEERKVFSLLHSKISRVIAKEVFGIENTEVLEAIECHSTLRANPSKMDMVLFTADKTSWDAVFNHRFIENMNTELEASLERGAFAYLKYTMERKADMAVLHPQVVEAYNELSSRLKTS